MNEKVQSRLTIIVLIVIIIVGIFLKGIPELKKSLGSSDKFITKKNYEDMIEYELNSIKKIILKKANQLEDNELIEVKQLILVMK